MEDYWKIAVFLRAILMDNSWPFWYSFQFLLVASWYDYRFLMANE